MSIRFTGQNQVEARDEELAVGDVITVKLRSHHGHDSKHRFIYEVTQILASENEPERTVARVRIAGGANP